MVDTLKSTALSPNRRLKLPSCGLRVSEMSISASTLILATMDSCSGRGTSTTCCKAPSTRKRTVLASDVGTKWMSEARRFTAWRVTISTA